MMEDSTNQVWTCELCKSIFPVPLGESTWQSGVALEEDVLMEEVDFLHCISECDVPLQPMEDTTPTTPLPATIQDLGEELMVTFKLTESSTQRGKRILVDSRGYNDMQEWKKEPTSPFYSWVCSLHTKNRRCPVPILLHGDSFQQWIHTVHINPANPGAGVAAQVSAAVKQIAK